jgi:hypothetical protein
MGLRPARKVWNRKRNCWSWDRNDSEQAYKRIGNALRVLDGMESRGEVEYDSVEQVGPDSPIVFHVDKFEKR